MRNLERIITKFEEIVSKNFCKDLARKVGFIQRSSSRLKGFEFAQAMMVPHAFLEAETLNSLAVRMLKINQECDLSASALSQRMNTEAAEKFMKACFEKILKETLQMDLNNFSDLPALSCFNRLLIEDSTQFQLHEKLSPYFKGCGGSSSKASIKIDFCFDYFSERCVEIKFFSGDTPDQALATQMIPLLQNKDLLIRDLGYYALERIKEIDAAQAYYISRAKSDIAIYETTTSSDPLDLALFLNRHICEGIIDAEVFIGKEKHSVRLVACLMSEAVINKRLRVVKENARRRGRQVSKKKLDLLQYNIFITNVPKNMLSNELILSTYRARWRVELIFKEWKSCLKLDMFKGYRRERFYCLLYGRLIMILLLGSISCVMRAYAAQLGKELSSFKLIKYLIQDHFFALSIQMGNKKELIERLHQDVARRLCQDKRQRLSLRKNVKLGIHYNNLKNKDLGSLAA